MISLQEHMPPFRADISAPDEVIVPVAPQSKILERMYEERRLMTICALSRNPEGEGIG
jgi:hypothetical protein